MTATKPQLITRYMFSVSAEIASYKLGESPAGFRVDLEFKRGDVKTDTRKFFESWAEELAKIPAEQKPPEDLDGRAEWLSDSRRTDDRTTRPKVLPWYGLQGKLTSGSDWLLVRSDGVAEMNGRATLQEETWGTDSNRRGGQLINTELSTVVDVGEAVPDLDAKKPERPNLTPAEIYDVWKGSRGKSQIQLTLGIRFAVAQATQPWAREEFRAEAGFWRFEDLPRHQYAANARAWMIDGLITSIEADVWQVRGFNELPLKIWPRWA